jgi:hypothetical protein
LELYDKSFSAVSSKIVSISFKFSGKDCSANNAVDATGAALADVPMLNRGAMEAHLIAM